MCKSRMPMWVGVTYLIYCAMILIVLIGGSGYAVFVLGHSGWWILAAFGIACCSYRPGRWAELVTGDTGYRGVDGFRQHGDRTDASEGTPSA
ncbi:MAG: hypothetical protein C4523_10575 [Myxococcales bacterium]|nr:MAG: hypothetical protein C4523_10575 [Myxococcales bacterium]